MTREQVETWYQHHEHELMRRAVAILRNVQDAEDVLNLVFMLLIECAPSLTAEWIERIAFARLRQRCLNVLRTRRSRSEIQELDEKSLQNQLKSRDTTPEKQAIIAEEIEEENRKFVDCLDRLSRVHLTVIICSYFLDWTYKRTAEVLEQPLMTTFCQQKAALKKLKDCLESKRHERGNQ